MRTGPACQECQYFDVLTEECRRHAPTLQVLGNKIAALFPRVTPATWCGEGKYEPTAEAGRDDS